MQTNVTYRKALQYFLNSRNEKEIIISTEATIVSMEQLINSEKENVSYRNILVSKAVGYQEIDYSVGNNTDEEGSVISYNNVSINKKKDNRLHQKSNNAISTKQVFTENMEVPAYEREQQQTRIRKTQFKNKDRTLNFKSVIQDFPKIFLADCTIGEKINKLLKYLIEILRSYLMRNIKSVT